MNNNIRQFLYEFNNLCRQDNRIKCWCVYPNDDFEREKLRIDIVFVNYNGETFNWHSMVDIFEITNLSENCIKDFTKYIFYDLQHGYEGDIFPDRKDGDE